MTDDEDRVAFHGTMMTKAELEATRAGLMTALVNVPKTFYSRREAIQADLALVKQAIKDVNVAKSRRDKAAADRRRSQGLVEQRRNTDRAIGKIGIQSGVVPSTTIPASATTSTPATKWPKGITTRGEYILMRAEQLRNQLRRCVEPLAFTTGFLPVLEAFVAEQQSLVTLERAARRVDGAVVVAAGPPAATRPKGCTCLGACYCESKTWRETWKDNR